MNASPRRTIALRHEPERERSSSSASGRWRCSWSCWRSVSFPGCAISGSWPRPRKRPRPRCREVHVVRPEPAAAADLSLAATTQAIQDSIIYARTSGYLSKRLRGHRGPREGGPAPGGDRVARDRPATEAGRSRPPAVREEPGSAEGHPRSRAGDDGALPGGRCGRRGRQADGRSERLCLSHGPGRGRRGGGVCRVEQGQRPATARADVVPARPGALQRHGDPAQRGRGRIDHGGQPRQQHRRGAVQRDRRRERAVRGGADRHAPRVRQRSPGICAERDRRSAGPGDGQRAASCNR